MIEKQELHCHACNKYVQFELDMGVNGNHVLNCPNCNHEHCRVVRDGMITGERWDARNGPSVFVSSTTTSGTAMYDTSSSSTTYLSLSWVNATTTG